jgi:hypothetical protein
MGSSSPDSPEKQDFKLPARLRREGNEGTATADSSNPSTSDMLSSDNTAGGTKTSPERQIESNSKSGSTVDLEPPEASLRGQPASFAGSSHLDTRISTSASDASYGAAIGGGAVPTTHNSYTDAVAFPMNPMQNHKGVTSQIGLQQSVMQQAAVASHLFASMMCPAAVSGSTTHAAFQDTSVHLPTPTNTNTGRQLMQPPQVSTNVALVPHSTATSITSTDGSFPMPTLTNRSAVPLFLDFDEQSLNEYQCLLRKQIELFETKEEELRGTAQGRNIPIQIGQVGIRCRHCSVLPKAARPKGSVYYSRTLEGVYQVAQNMAKVHFNEKCSQMPALIKKQLLSLQKTNKRASGGKQYWVDGLRAHGVYEAEDGKGLRFRHLEYGSGGF